MGIALACIGAIIAALGLFNGILAFPTNVAQQTVQELRFLEGILGLILWALGLMLHRLVAGAPAKADQPVPDHGRYKPAGTPDDGIAHPFPPAG